MTVLLSHLEVNGTLCNLVPADISKDNWLRGYFTTLVVSIDMGLRKKLFGRYGWRFRSLVAGTILLTVGLAIGFTRYLQTVGTTSAGVAAIGATCFVLLLNFGTLGIIVGDNIGTELSRLLTVAESIEDGDFSTSAQSVEMMRLVGCLAVSTTCGFHFVAL